MPMMEIGRVVMGVLYRTMGMDMGMCLVGTTGSMFMHMVPIKMCMAVVVNEFRMQMFMTVVFLDENISAGCHDQQGE